VIVKCTNKRFSWYGSNDFTAYIEPPSCWQYKPGDILASRPLNWDEIINEDDDDENWADPGGPSGGRSPPGDGDDNDDSEGEEDMHGGEKGTRKRKVTKEGKEKVKKKATEEGKGKGIGQGKGMVKQTAGGDDISRAIAWQLQKAMYEADSVTQGSLERVYLELEASSAVLIFSDDDSHSTEESASESES